MMGRLLGSWREYDIGQSTYEIVAFVSGKEVGYCGRLGSGLLLSTCRNTPTLLRDSVRTGVKV